MREPDLRSSTRGRSTHRWPARVWAGIAVVAVVGAACGVLLTLAGGFVFDPDDHDAAYYAARAVEQAAVLITTAGLCAAGGLSGATAVVRGSSRPEPAAGTTVGAIAVLAAVLLLLLGLVLGVPAVEQAQRWATRPPV